MKLLITLQAHSKNPVKKGPSPVGQPFKMPITANSFKHKMNINFNDDNVANSAVDVFQFQGYGSEECSFTLLLDGTKKSEDEQVMPVNDDFVDTKIKELKDTVYKYQGDIHKPYYVEISYNKFHFYGNCKKFDIDYLLFDNSGKAKLAEVNLDFMIIRDPEKATLVGKTSSPDMTHVHTFKDGDKLTNMCYEIYDDPSYYLQIAKINNIPNFRHIKPGTQIVFPPLIIDSDV